MLTFEKLRQANMARQIEWGRSDQKIGLGFRAIELAGETGEACNIVKKLEREKLGLQGSRATTEDLARELADVAICVDLTALSAGIDLGQAVVDKFNATSRAQGLATHLDSIVSAATLPPLDDDLIDILGRPNFACTPIAEALRKSGREIKRRSEHEQAAVIHWMLGLLLKHGASWKSFANAELHANRMESALQPPDPETGAT
jgi:NTP pyrophosphatase (non-canonical NTP hydrolase)